jgi:DivIVA domain-containing protein
MDVTPQELRGSEIKEAWRGYHRDEVDELLERAAVTIENLSQQLSTAGSAPAPAADPSSLQMSRDDADTLQRTLLLAQRAADDAVNDAQAQARKLIEESEARAQTLVGEAEATARRIAESERRRLEAEIQDLASRRDALQADADALEAYASAYRERVRAAIEADLDRLGNGTIDPPTARPELSDVEVSAPVADPGREQEPRGDEDRSGPGGGEYPDTRAITIDAPSVAASFGTESAPSPSPVAAPPRPAETEWPPAAPNGPDATVQPGAAAAPTFGVDPGRTTSSAAADLGAPSGTSWLSANDDWSPADPAFDERAPWEQPTAAHEPFASDVPMEATAVDGDALDDDAFFASLRDAVREEEPLGPRDADSSGFFDDDVSDDRRRFRRRR